MVLVTRLWRLFVGLFAFGFGIALLVHADLGLGPWDVLHQGISERTDIPIGTVGIVVGALLLLLWICAAGADRASGRSRTRCVIGV